MLLFNSFMCLPVLIIGVDAMANAMECIVNISVYRTILGHYIKVFSDNNMNFVPNWDVDRRSIVGNCNSFFINYDFDCPNGQ
jgi:hypothetical protein